MLPYLDWDFQQWLGLRMRMTWRCGRHWLISRVNFAPGQWRWCIFQVMLLSRTRSGACWAWMHVLPVGAFLCMLFAVLVRTTTLRGSHPSVPIPLLSSVPMESATCETGGPSGVGGASEACVGVGVTLLDTISRMLERVGDTGTLIVLLDACARRASVELTPALQHTGAFAGR